MKYLVAVLIALGVLLVGFTIRWYIAKKGGDLLGPTWKRSVTGFVVLTAVLAGLASIAVALNPSTTDTLVVSVVKSLPGLLLAGIIVALSVLLARIVSAITVRALRAWSAVVAQRVARLVRVAIVAAGSIIALEQLGVSTDLLIIVITAIVAALALATALAMGLGSVPLARQVAAGRHVSDRFRVGQTISTDGYSGVIAELGLSSVKLETETDRHIEVPNLTFLEQPVEVLSNPEPPGSET